MYKCAPLPIEQKCYSYDCGSATLKLCCCYLKHWQTPLVRSHLNFPLAVRLKLFQPCCDTETYSDRETLQIWSLNMPAVATLKLCQLFRHWNSVSCWSTKKLPAAVTRKPCLTTDKLKLSSGCDTEKLPAAVTLKQLPADVKLKFYKLVWHAPFNDVEDLPAEWHSPAVVSLRIASFSFAEPATFMPAACDNGTLNDQQLWILVEHLFNSLILSKAITNVLICTNNIQ